MTQEFQPQLQEVNQHTSTHNRLESRGTSLAQDPIPTLLPPKLWDLRPGPQFFNRVMGVCVCVCVCTAQALPTSWGRQLWL